MRKSSKLFFGQYAIPIWTIALAMSVQMNLYAQGEIQRGTPKNEGKGWVERNLCNAAVRDGGRLVVRADFGSISVKAGPSNRMSCVITLHAYRAGEEEAKRSFQSYELAVRSLADGGVMLVGKSAHHGERNGISADYQIVVPMKFNVDLETNGGDLRVGNLDGELRGTTAGGNITSGDISGPVQVVTSGGEIRLGNIGQQVDARTAGGDIRLGNVKGDATLQTSGGEIMAGVIGGSFSAQSAGGDIILRGASGPVRAQTAGGQIQVGQCQDTIRAETAGGNIRLHGARGLVVAQTAGGSIDLFRMQSAVRAESAAGPILVELNANRNSFAASQLATTTGDVQVFLPPDLPVNIDAAIQQAFGHKIVSDFPIHIQHDEESFRHRSQRAEGALNGGGKLLRIRVATGNIEIHKLDPQTIEEFKARQEAFWKMWKDKLKQASEKDDDR